MSRVGLTLDNRLGRIRLNGDNRIIATSGPGGAFISIRTWTTRFSKTSCNGDHKGGPLGPIPPTRRRTRADSAATWRTRRTRRTQAAPGQTRQLSRPKVRLKADLSNGRPGSRPKNSAADQQTQQNPERTQDNGQRTRRRTRRTRRRTRRPAAADLGSRPGGPGDPADPADLAADQADSAADPADPADPADQAISGGGTWRRTRRRTRRDLADSAADSAGPGGGPIADKLQLQRTYRLVSPASSPHPTVVL